MENNKYEPSKEEIADKNNFKVILEIVSRAEKLNLLMFDRLSLIMDLEGAYRQFNLRLEDILKADDLNFSHDIIGIQENIDRQTGNFNSFTPRFAKN